MHTFDESRVRPEEIDSLGHLNVRFYLERVGRSEQAMLAALGLTEETLKTGGTRMRRVDTYSRFQREQFEGAELAVLGGVLGTEPTRIRSYFEVRNPAKDEIAALFIVTSELTDRNTRAPRELPAELRQANEQYGVLLPEYARPRSLSLDPPRSDVRLADLLARIPEATEFGMTGRREAEILAEDCGPDGVLRDEVELMFLMFRREAESLDPKKFGPPVLRTDEGHRLGWAMMETRNVEFSRPRAGDTVVFLGADVGIAEKSRQSRRWSFVRDTGELLGIHDTVGIAIDLDARKAIPIPRSIREEMERCYLPEYA
ncbi:MAG: thioesterase family protein [Pseudomonadales bacterium]